MPFLSWPSRIVFSSLPLSAAGTRVAWTTTVTSRDWASQSTPASLSISAGEAGSSRLNLAGAEECSRQSAASGGPFLGSKGPGPGGGPPEDLLVKNGPIMPVQYIKPTVSPAMKSKPTTPTTARTTGLDPAGFFFLPAGAASLPAAAAGAFLGGAGAASSSSAADGAGVSSSSPAGGAGARAGAARLSGGRAAAGCSSRSGRN